MKAFFIAFLIASPWSFQVNAQSSWSLLDGTNTRTPLATNCPRFINQELKALDVMRELAINDKNFVKIILGADENYFSVAVLFSAPFSVEQTERIKSFTKSYCEFRWEGFSPRTSLTESLMSSVSDLLTDVEITAVHSAVPYIPLGRLLPFSGSLLASLPWIKPGRNVFQIFDDDIGIIFVLNVQGGHTFATPYFFDAQEIHADKQLLISEVARQLLAKDVSPSKLDVLNYWHLLKDRLASRGISWSTPEELNSVVHWD